MKAGLGACPGAKNSPFRLGFCDDAQVMLNPIAFFEQDITELPCWEICPNPECVYSTVSQTFMASRDTQPRPSNSQFRHCSRTNGDLDAASAVRRRQAPRDL